MPPRDTAPRNTGDKDARGRTIWMGPRGGLFVLTASGSRGQPVGLMPRPAGTNAATGPARTDRPMKTLPLMDLGPLIARHLSDGDATAFSRVNRDTRAALRNTMATRTVVDVGLRAVLRDGVRLAASPYQTIPRTVGATVPGIASWRVLKVDATKVELHADAATPHGIMSLRITTKPSWAGKSLEWRAARRVHIKVWMPLYEGGRPRMVAKVEFTGAGEYVRTTIHEEILRPTARYIEDSVRTASA